jgi:hypothetical protein
MLHFLLEALAATCRASARTNARSETSAALSTRLVFLACARVQDCRSRLVRGRRRSAMIRLPIPSVDAAVVHGDGRAERISRRIDF